MPAKKQKPINVLVAMLEKLDFVHNTAVILRKPYVARTNGVKIEIVFDLRDMEQEHSIVIAVFEYGREAYLDWNIAKKIGELDDVMKFIHDENVKVKNIH